MAQDILDRPINPNTKSGTQLADDLSGTGKFQDSLLTNHAGTSRPSYADSSNAGLIWFDTTDSPLIVEKIWNGTVDIPARRIDYDAELVIDQISTWEDDRDYPIGEYVKGSDHELYRGLVSPNENQDPADDGNPTYWRRQTGLAYEVQEGNGDLKLKTLVYSLGNWDMDTFGARSITVDTGLDPAKIIDISVTVRDDDGATAAVYPIGYASPTGGGDSAGGWEYDKSFNRVQVTRITGGFFDGPAFNYDTDYNRGWIRITYYE
jgi:hypothetical protein